MFRMTKITMDNCIFCKIVKGELPKYKVYEDELFLGFLDIYPRTKGHSLLIPKQHFLWTYDVPEFGKYWEAALKITKAMQKVLSPTFITYVTHGLDVKHAHIHILPRVKGEEGFVPEVKSFPKEEMTDIAEKIYTKIKELK